MRCESASKDAANERKNQCGAGRATARLPQRATELPIVFTLGNDPVGSGYVARNG